MHVTVRESAFFDVGVECWEDICYIRSETLTLVIL